MLNPRRRAPSPELIYFGQQQLISFFQNIFSDHSRTPKGQCLWLTKNWKSCLTEFRCTVRSGPHWSTRIKKKSSCLQTKLCIAVSSFCHYSLRVVYDLTWLFVCTMTLSEDLEMKPTWIYIKHGQAENRWTRWTHFHPLYKIKIKLLENPQKSSRKTTHANNSLTYIFLINK